MVKKLIKITVNLVGSALTRRSIQGRCERGCVTPGGLPPGQGAAPHVCSAAGGHSTSVVIGAGVAGLIIGILLVE